MRTTAPGLSAPAGVPVGLPAGLGIGPDSFWEDAEPATARDARIIELGSDPDLRLYTRSGPIRFESREQLRTFLASYDGAFGPLFGTRRAWLLHAFGTDWRYQLAAGGALALAGYALYHTIS